MQTLIALLVFVNVGLAGWLGYSRVAKTTGAQTQAPDMSITAGTPGATVAKSTLGTKSGAGMQIRQSKVSWESLASTDLKAYVANLRSVSCPEETVKDIIVAEVNRRFASREKALKLKQTDYNPWEAPAREGKDYYEWLKQIRNLVAEKKKVLRDALGVDVAVEIPTQLPNRTMNKYEDAFGALPEQKRDAVRAVQDGYWDKIDEIKKKTLGFLDPADQAEINSLKKERREALAKILTPQELLDFDVKTSVLSDTMKNRLNGMAVSDEEFKSIFSKVQPLEQQMAELRIAAGISGGNDEATRQRRAEVDAMMKQQFKEVVGEVRYAEYERGQDPVYRGLAKVGDANGLPQASVLKAYEVQKALQEEASRLAANTTLSNEDRQQTLASMRQQAAEALQQVMGPQAYQSYVKSTEGQGRSANRTSPGTVFFPGAAVRLNEVVDNVQINVAPAVPKREPNP